MRITILALGSRGDTQPYVALGRGLLASGHTVTLVAGDEFADFVAAHGLAYAPVGVNFRAFVSDHMQPALESGRNAFAALRTIFAEGRAYAAVMTQRIEAACRDADLVIAGLVGGLLGYHIAEAHGRPLVLALTIPLPGRTATSANILFPFQPRWGARFNLLTHALIEQFLWLLLRPLVNGWREQRGLDLLPRFEWPLERLYGAPVPVLYLHSPSLIPRPPDWGPHQHVTGACFLDRAPDWEPPADLVAFLGDGPPPVYVGFGSMNDRDPERVSGMVLDALRRAGLRGVLNTGWGGMSQTDTPDDVSVLHDIPHDWLFPRVAAVVHHGGVGTTAAGLRAGVPSVIVPFFGDQPFWAGRVHALGVGPAPLPRQRLSADRLAFALRIATTNQGMRARAAALGARLRAEDGVGAAVHVVNQILSTHPGP